MCKYIDYCKQHKFSKYTVSYVNNNDWTLQEVVSDNTDVKYVLNTKNRYFFLDKDGDALFCDENLKDYRLGEFIKFSNFKDTVSPRFRIGWNILD